MKLKVSVERINHGVDEYKKRLRILAQHKAFVKAGILGKHNHRDDGALTNAAVASLAEYGTSKVAARPFIRPAFELHREEYLEMLREAFKEAVHSNNEQLFPRALARIGMRMAADIKNYVTQGNNLRPNAPSTIAQKGSSRPLVDSAQMIRGVDYEVGGLADTGTHEHGGPSGGHHGGHEGHH